MERSRTSLGRIVLGHALDGIIVDNPSEESLPEDIQSAFRAVQGVRAAIARAFGEDVLWSNDESAAILVKGYLKAAVDLLKATATALPSEMYFQALGVLALEEALQDEEAMADQDKNSMGVFFDWLEIAVRQKIQTRFQRLTLQKELPAPSVRKESAAETDLVGQFQPIFTALLAEYDSSVDGQPLKNLSQDFRHTLLYSPFVILAEGNLEKACALMDEASYRRAAAQTLSGLCSGIDLRSAQSFYAHAASSFREAPGSAWSGHVKSGHSSGASLPEFRG